MQIRLGRFGTAAALLAALGLGAPACGDKGEPAATESAAPATADETAAGAAAEGEQSGAPEGEAPKAEAPKGDDAAKAAADKPAAKAAKDAPANTPAKEVVKVDATPKAAPGDIPAPEDVAGPPADAGKSASGLTWKVLKPGAGDAMPAAEDTVKVHYTGWTKDGKMFDSSVKRGQPASFPLNRVIKGWTEGLQLMKVGEKRRFWIPAGLAYGETPARPGAPSGQLTFDVELLEIKAAPKVDVPADVAAPPADAKKTDSGLAYKILKAVPDAKAPAATDTVEVHYSGWTTDGKMFDSSVTRGRPATFPLNRVIKGWTEGLQLMKVGEKARFWIPAGLAYGETPARPGAPAGQLTFDVELLSIK